MVYSLLRYVVFQGVSVEQIPVYVTNKAVSWTGLILLGLAPLLRSERRRPIGQAGLLFVLLHLVLSLTMLNPVYFGKFYQQDGHLTWQAEASMLTGAVAAVLMLKLFIHPGENSNSQGSLIPGLGRTILIFSGFHVLLMGYEGWAVVTDWPAGLPPITLLSFICVLVFLVLRQRKRARDAED